MFNLLTPPTDSFYKFVGIGGLIIFIVSGIFIFSTVYKDDYKLSLAKGELDIEQYKIREFISDIKYDTVNGQFENVNIDKLEYWLNNRDNTKADSIVTQSYYGLPDSLRKSLSSLIISQAKKEIKFNALKAEVDNMKSLEGFVIAALYLGELIAIIGILSWYFHIQKPLDDERKNRESQNLFSGTDLSTSCHSCYKTFYFSYERGLEKDKSINRFFCLECYNKGEYTNPDLKFEEAKKELVSKLKNLNYSNRRIKKAKKNFEKLFRWQRMKKW